MNKRIIFYFLIALIVIIATTDSSYADLMTAKFDVDATLAFWTPEIIKSAKPLITADETGSEAEDVNAIVDIQVNQDDPGLTVQPFDNPKNTLNYPVGMLFLFDPESGQPQVCTASVINTDNGNIGMTTGHCLFNDDGIEYNHIAFSPGYNAGNPGPLGIIAAEFVAAPVRYHRRRHGVDYGMMRFNFNDTDRPKLQLHSGANGLKVGLKGNLDTTTVFGYPQDGDMQKCTKDGTNLCGVTINDIKRIGHEYVMPNVYLGSGVTGAPWMFGYDSNRNLGYTYGNYAFNVKGHTQSESPVYDTVVFNNLLKTVSKI